MVTESHPLISGHRPSGSRIGEFQATVARAFFSTPESKGFFIAGGAALIVNGIIDRDTDDLDAFTAHADVTRALSALERVAQEQGWSIEKAKVSQTFVRIVVRSKDDEMVVELAQDAEPIKSLRASFLGPVLDPEDSAGQKTLALFGRAQPRDFADVYRLAQSFGKARLLELAAERDTGFDPQVFAQMLVLLGNISDRQIPLPADDVPRLRRFFEQWAAALMSQRTGSLSPLPECLQSSDTRVSIHLLSTMRKAESQGSLLTWPRPTKLLRRVAPSTTTEVSATELARMVEPMDVC